MLTYPMDERGGETLYGHLYRCIRDDILAGRLSVGERLPSKRALADHLRVSVTTVEGAYDQLEAEGWVHSVPRRGVFVSLTDGRPPCGGAAAEIPPGPDPPSWELDLVSGRPDPALFPAAAWARLCRQALGSGTLFDPVPPQGLFRLRAAVAEDLREYKGMAVSPEQIVVGAGAEYLYLLLAQLLGDGAVIALEDPGYPKTRLVYRKSGARTVLVPLDRHGLDMAALTASGATVAHLSPSHHWPTGVVTPISRRHALLRWAEEREGILIEDDYDSALRFTGRPIPTLQSIDGGGRVIYMDTFSQTISPAMRLGYMVLPPRILERYRRELGSYASTVPALEQQVLARFLESGQYGRHLSRMRNAYRARRGAVLDAFRHAPFADRISISEQGAGLHFLLSLDTEEADETIRRRGEARGVRLGFLSQFAETAVPAHALVVNYASLSPDRLPEAMELLDQVLFPKGGA